jgi:maltoporin
MRSNRLRGCLVVAALLTGTSASAQNTDDKTNDKAAPDQVAQAEPPPPTPPPTAENQEAGPTTPGARETFSEEQMRKMVEEQVAKMRPKGPSIEFSGYGRAGVGLAIRGGKQVCFGLGGADAKWRLGNECDYVIEPQFTGRLVTLANGSSWGVVVMPGLYRTWEDPAGANDTSDATFFDNIPTRFNQFYFFGENVPELLGGRVWAGRRFYDRLHIGINDQFLEIHDSDGAGLEEMKAGPGKLSIAFLMNPNSEVDRVGVPGMAGVTTGSANLAPFKLQARFTDIKTAPEGNIQFWVGLHGSANSLDNSGEDTVVPKPDTLVRLGVYHTLNKVLNGQNFIGAKVEYSKNHFLWRAVLKQTMQLNQGHDGVDFIAEFRSTKDRANEDAEYATNNWLSAGARYDRWISGPFRFLVEAGYDGVFPEVGDAMSLFKVTGCFAVSAGDHADARPTIRAFYTHGFWNEAAQGPGGVYSLGQSGRRAAQIYGDKTNGGSFGLQAEAWW